MVKVIRALTNRAVPLCFLLIIVGAVLVGLHTKEDSEEKRNIMLSFGIIMIVLAFLILGWGIRGKGELLNKLTRGVKGFVKF